MGQDSFQKHEHNGNHLRLKRTTVGVLLVVLAFLVLSASISIWRQYNHAWNLAEVQAQNASERLERWIQYPLRFFSALPLEALAESNGREAEFFDQIVERSNRFYSVYFLNNDGETVKKFGPDILSEPQTTWSNSHIGEISFLQFGQAFYEQKIGSWLMPIRHKKPIGSQHLFAVAYMDGRAFEELFLSIHPQGEGSASIFRNDGLMLARIPFADKLVGKSFGEGPLFKKILPHQPNGVSRPPKKTDGIERVVAHRTLAGYPLVITIGVNVDHILDKTVNNLFSQNIPFVGIFIVSLLFAYVLWHQVKSAETAQIKLIKIKDELKKLASIDPLTNCLNRRAFIEKATVERDRYKRNAVVFSCIMIDLDHFKEVNDTYGHLIGDEILKNFGQICRDSLRTVDFIGRYGGEEFMIFLPETELDGCQDVAERILQTLRDKGIQTSTQTINITFSAGIASIQFPDETIEQIIKRADDALYVAKRDGRNRVIRHEKTFIA